MKVLTRYIFKEFIRSFIVSISIIYAILLIQLMIKLLDKFLGKGFDSYFLLKLLFYNTAWIIALAIPMAVLVASILTYGKLSSDNEVVGFKSSGIKMYDIIKPSLFSALFAGVFTITTAFLVSKMINYPFSALALSFAPGGAEAMIILSVVFDVDPSFVGIHHTLRLLILTILFPIIAKQLSKK